jgi:hypothetical protein
MSSSCRTCQKHFIIKKLCEKYDVFVAPRSGSETMAKETSRKHSWKIVKDFCKA